MNREQSDDVPDRPPLDDPAQFADLFDRYARDLYRYLARRVGDRADDLVSETFLIALRRRHTYDPQRSAVRAWLYGIATNLVLQHRDEEIRLLRLTARMAGTTRLVVADHDDAAAARVDAGSVTHSLAAALAVMPAGDRDVLLLTAWAHLTPTEAAAALDIPAGTVRSRLHRVRAALQAEVLGPDEEGRRHA